MSAKKISDTAWLMTKELSVTNKLGIHARPAAMFVKVANKFTCNIFVEKDGEKVNGKSIMGLMMLAAGPGSKLKVHAEGQDASAAIAELETLMNRKFDEDYAAVADKTFMVMLGDFTPDMGDFTQFAKVFLGEAVKYVVLLIFAVLAIRLWRRGATVTGKNRRVHFLLAGAATGIAGAVGYFSFCHSMGRLYSYYGTTAFLSGHPSSALVLFSRSAQYWENADAIGKEGICLLWVGKPDLGSRLLDEARAQKWKADSFGNYFEGLYYLYNGHSDQAIPFLEAASSDPIYHWNVVKLFATLQLDWNHPQEAEKLMAPFKDIPVTEMDHAYVMASLDLAEGKKAGAQGLWKEFAATNLPPFWQARFDKLGAKIQIRNP